MLPFSLARIELRGLSVSGNPLAFPPMKVCRQGVARIQEYIKERISQQIMDNDEQSVCVYSSKPYNSDDSNSDNGDTMYEHI